VELAGGKAPESMDGRSILPLLVRSSVLISYSDKAVNSMTCGITIFKLGLRVEELALYTSIVTLITFFPYFFVSRKQIFKRVRKRLICQVVARFTERHCPVAPIT